MATYTINNLRGDDETGDPGSIVWVGDADNEYIFGGDWHDQLTGNAGNDIMYGFEGDDEIIGGDGVDRLFGDAGDDTIFVGDYSFTIDLPVGPNATGIGTSVASPNASEGDFASGGSGNDEPL